jgi:activating signal cointegrator 1
MLSDPTAAWPPGTVPALSFTQPHGTLVAVGAKRYETRHWTTAYRGLLAIHASKRMPMEHRWRCVAGPGFGPKPLYDALREAGYAVRPDGRRCSPGNLPLGKVLAIVNLTAVRRISYDAGAQRSADGPDQRLDPTELTDRERAFGDYRPGRWAWDLRVLHVFDPPIGATGRLDLWPWTPPEDLDLDALAEASGGG